MGRISCAEILEVGKNFFAVSSVKKMSQFEEVSPKKSRELPTAALVIYISSYPVCPQGITVKYT